MLNKKIQIYLIVSILFSIMLPAGIIMIIFGAKSSSFMLVFGICFCVFGFYGTPLLWSNYGNLKTMKTLYDQITLDNIQEISKLAQLNNKKEEQIINEIKHLIFKRYLVGYEIYENKFVVPYKNKKMTENEILAKNGEVNVVTCNGCGAKVDILGTKASKCPYCGTTVTK